MNKNLLAKISIIIFFLVIFFGGNNTILQKETFAQGNNLTNIAEDDAKQIAQNAANAQNQTTAVAADKITVGYLNCDWYDLACHGVNFLQLIVMTIGNVLVGVAGLFLDFFLIRSIQSTTYHDAAFIKQGWEILRDITNIVFIFSLLVIAFQMVLGQNEGDNKKRLVKTILIALTINFSLYASFLMIDVGNLFAYTFYKRIDAPVVNYAGARVGSSEVDGINATKSTSLAIAGRFQPQTLLNQTTGDEKNVGQRMVMVVIIGVINGVIIYTFISVAFLFLGRTIGLFVNSILSALALASITLGPKTSSLKYIGFQNWLSEHIKLSFMPAVFLFFLYLAVEFMNISLFVPGDSISGQGDFIQSILSVLVPMGAVITIILLAKKIAGQMSGELGSQISGYVTKGTGLAIAGTSLLATGGASAILSGGGRVMQGVGKATSFFGGKKSGEKISNWGSRARNASTYVGSAKFDVTKIPGFKTVLGKDALETTQKISSKSTIGHISNWKTDRQKNPVFSNEYTQIQKEKIEREKTRVKDKIEGSKSSSDWQEELEKERDKILSENLAKEISNQLDKTFEADRKEEKRMYREVIDHAAEVQKEEKDLKKLNDELGNLRQTLNAAKATGNTTQIDEAKNAVRDQENIIIARKAGREVNRLDVAHLRTTSAESAYKYFTLGAGNSSGKEVDSYKSKYEQQRKEVQEKEQAFIDKKIKDLRDKADEKKNPNISESARNKLNKEATLIGKKGKSLLTDSEKEDKKGEFDKKESK